MKGSRILNKSIDASLADESDSMVRQAVKASTSGELVAYLVSESGGG